MKPSEKIFSWESRFIYTRSWREIMWDAHELRMLMLFSLGAQTVLTIFGSRRRRYHLAHFTRFLLSSCYFLAGPVITFVLGKFSQMNNLPNTENLFTEIFYKNYGILMSWWAPLLLVHIGGPDMIIYSADKFKLRQYVGLGLQVAAAFQILYESWINHTYFHPYMTLPLYVAGIIKVAERFQALRSLSQSENQVINTLAKPGNGTLPEQRFSFTGTEARLDDLERVLLVKAYQRFDHLKPHIVNWLGHPSSTYVPSSSVEDYIPECVFRITEFELSFMYDTLFTKAPINYFRSVFLGRILCIGCLAFGLCEFSIMCSKANGNLLTHIVPISCESWTCVILFLDTLITFVLLVGAIALEIYEMKLLLFSDWAILHSMLQNEDKFMSRFLKIVAPRNPSKEPRWSDRMYQLNLLSYCLKKKISLGTLINHGLKAVAHYEDHKKYRARQCIHIPVKLKMLILEYIKEVRKKGDQPFYKTGEWKLKVCNCPNELEWSFQKVSSSEASGSPDTVLEADEQTIPIFEASASPDIGPQAREQTSFGMAIIIWHIATDICFHLDDCQQDHHNQDVCFCLDDGQQGINLQAQRKLSKILSDYMMYLLAMQPDMLSVATGDILFRGAYAQMKNFLKPTISTTENKARLCKDLKEESVDEIFRRGVRKNNMLTSDWNVLSDVKKLVEELGRTDAAELEGRDDKWKIISNVWVEMLCYGACKCPWMFHVERLGQGGELITHIWLLLQHEKDTLNKK